MDSKIVTDSSGIAETRYYADEQDEGEVVITARFEDLEVTANITIIPVPEVAKLAFDSLPDSVGLEQDLLINVTAYKEDKTPVPEGTLIQLETTSGSFVVDESGQQNPAYVFTDDKGMASATWNSGTTSGNVTFTAIAGNKKAETESYIRPGEPAQIEASIEMRKPGVEQPWEPIPLEGIDVDKYGDYDFRVKATIRDAFGNRPEEGYRLRVRATQGEISAPTVDNGVYYFYLHYLLFDDMSGEIEIAITAGTARTVLTVRFFSG